MALPIASWTWAPGIAFSASRLGYNVVPVDLKSLSFVDAIVPVTYDGTTLPFDNDSFDVAPVITVFHHAPDPDAILAEVRRVARRIIVTRRIIVIEEIYENLVEKYFTYAIDSLFNFEFFSHPRSNRTDSEWRKTFQKLRLDVSEAVYSRSLGLLRRVTYVLLRADDGAKSSLYRSRYGYPMSKNFSSAVIHLPVFEDIGIFQDC